MSGLFGAKGSVNATALSGMAFQSSAYGNPVPILYGTNRLTSNLLDYDDFWAYPSTTKIGGFMGMGGSKVVTGYTYYANTIMGLCEGPVVAVSRVWNDQDILTLATASWYGTSLLTGARPQTAWGLWTTKHPAKALPYSGTALVVSNSINLPGGTLGNWGFEVTGLLATEADTTTKILIGTGTGSLTVFTLLDCNGVAVTSMAAYPAWVTYVNNTLTASTLSLVGGVYKVTFASAPANGASIYWVGNSIIVNDAKPASVIPDFLTNVDYGASVPSGYLADLTQGGAARAYSTYCTAMGFKIAPVFKDPKGANEHLRDILDATNSEVIRTPSAGGVMQIQVIPYGDVAVSANGASYAPVLTIQAALTDDDYLGVIDATSTTIGTDPIQITRSSPGDTYNTVPVSFCDRMAGYNVSTLSIPEPTDAALNGTRKASAKSMPMVVLRTHAQVLSAILGQAQVFKKNRFKFQVGWRFSRLEPMDLITIQSNIMGLGTTTVRIISVTWPDESSEDQGLTIEAESSPIGWAHATVQAPPSSGGTTTNTQIDPGATFAPVIFDVAPLASITGGPEIVIGATGGIDWGGCNVYISNDNLNFSPVGQITSKATYGTLTAGMLATGGASVDLTTAQGTLTTITTAQALAGQGLCWVAGASGGSGGEMVDFSTATLGAAFQYTLTLPVRGAYGTTAATHANGAAFMALDAAPLRYAVPSGWLGSPIYIKLQAFNRWGVGLQSLASTGVITYTPTSQGTYANPDGNPTTTLTGMNADDILSRSEKPALINQYNQIVAIQGSNSTVGSLDYQAYQLGVSHSAFDTAVGALFTWLSGLTPSWTDLTKDTPLGTGGGALLRSLWATIATEQQKLMAAIQSAALSAAATNTLVKLNVMGLKSPSALYTTYASKPTLPNGTYPAGSCWVTTDGKEVQVNADGTAWEDVIVAATGLFGHLVASQLTVANWDNLVVNPNSDPDLFGGQWESAPATANIAWCVLAPRRGVRVLTCGADGTVLAAITANIPAKVGDTFFFQADGIFASSYGGTPVILLVFYDTDRNYLTHYASAAITSASSAAPSTVVCTGIAPAGTGYFVAALWHSGGTVDQTTQWNNFYLRRCMDAQMTVDGFFTAQSAAVGQFIRSTGYTAGSAGNAPVGFKLGGSTFPCTDILGNVFNAQLELGGSINLQGYQLNQLGVAKLYYNSTYAGAIFQQTMIPVGTFGNTSAGWTWTAPSMGAAATPYQVLVTLVGGGAGGGYSAAYGGGAGAMVQMILTVRGGTVLSGQVGAGGLGQTSGTANGAGGATTLQITGNNVSGYPSSTTLWTAGGGATTGGGGTLTCGITGGLGLAGSGGNSSSPVTIGVNFTAWGGGGGNSSQFPWSAGTGGNGGAASPFGPGGNSPGSSPVYNTTNFTGAFGAGGGGGSASAGGNGAHGLVKIQIL